VSRLRPHLNALRAAGRKALVTFITGGDPDRAATVPALHALVEGGADVLEIGVPFSDPEAEGPAIQRSSERSLAAGTRMLDVLDMVTEFRRGDTATPIVLMGYLNPIERMGYQTFVERAANAGVDGVIVVNLPPEAAGELRRLMLARHLDLIFLVAPTTTPARIGLIASQASGFVYYVSLKGVTGADRVSDEGIDVQVARIREHTALPVMVGFGIKDGPSARTISALADGVVIGSVLVSAMERHRSDVASIPAVLRSQVADIRSAIDHP
jgi:tryptophan synthase alpha chain